MSSWQELFDALSDHGAILLESELRDIALIAERCLRHDALNKMATLTKDEYSPAPPPIGEIGRDVSSIDIDAIDFEAPADIKGRFQSELFWRGAFAMRAAIRSALKIAGVK